MSAGAEDHSDDDAKLGASRAETPLARQESHDVEAAEETAPALPEGAEAEVEDGLAAGDLEEEEDEDGAGKRRKDTPEGLVWVVLTNSKTVEKFRCVRALVPKELSVTEIRRFTCSKVGCPFKEFQLQMDGEHLWAGRLQPFLDAEGREYRVKWRKVNRLAKYIEVKQTGGVRGRCSKYGRTIMHYIALAGDVDMFQEAVAAVRADVDMEEYINVQDKLGDTVLTLAAIAGYTEIVALCIEREADLEKKNTKGRTALLLAAEHGHSDVVSTLLYANANLDPSKGTTCPGAIYLAELNQRLGVSQTIAQYLEDQEGADEDF